MYVVVSHASVLTVLCIFMNYSTFSNRMSNFDLIQTSNWQSRTLISCHKPVPYCSNSFTSLSCWSQNPSGTSLIPLFHHSPNSIHVPFALPPNYAPLLLSILLPCKSFHFWEPNLSQRKGIRRGEPFWVGS